MLSDVVVTQSFESPGVLSRGIQSLFQSHRPIPQQGFDLGNIG